MWALARRVTVPRVRAIFLAAPKQNASDGSYNLKAGTQGLIQKSPILQASIITVHKETCRLLSLLAVEFYWQTIWVFRPRRELCSPRSHSLIYTLKHCIC